MTSAETAVVLVDTVEVIQERFLDRLEPKGRDVTSLGGEISGNLALENAVLEVELLNGKLDQVVDLVPEVPGGPKSLEVDDEDVGRLPDFELLRRGLVLLALRKGSEEWRKSVRGTK